MGANNIKFKTKPSYFFITSIQLTLFVLLYLNPGEVMAMESIQAFKMTDIDSKLELRYLLDEQTSFHSGIRSQRDRHPTFQEEFSVQTRNYIFHPNMLSISLGGSLLLDQSRYQTLTEEYTSEEELLGYNTRLDFFKKKPVPVSLYYDKQNPSVTVGLGGRYLQENTKYGIDLAVLEPLSPVQITVKAYRHTTLGEGLNQITDNETEHADLRLYSAYGSGNHVQLFHQVNNRDSRSGSTNLPINTRTTSTTTTSLDSKNLFGKLRQVQLINNISYSTQEEYPRREEVRFNPILNWQLNPAYNSFLRFNYTDSEEETTSTTQKYLITGVGYSKLNNSASFDIHGEENQSSSIEYQSSGINLKLSRNHPLTTGRLKLSYSGSLDQHDQSSNSAVSEIFGEEHVLNGTTPVTLRRENIESSSIVVSNTGRTQIYIEDLDYRLIIIGTETQIQRLAAGNIIDGQTVLLDYSYQTGGSFAYDTISNNIQLKWMPSPLYDLYIRLQDTEQKLREGDPSTPLNSATSVTTGVRAEQSLLVGIDVGGDANFIDHKEDINSYTEQNYSAFIRLPLPLVTNLQLSLRHQETDNKNTEEDVNLTAYLLRLRSRPWLRTQLNYEYSYEDDTGGTLDRLLKIQRLQLNWAYRQLTLAANANYTTEEQGNYRGEHWAIRFNLLRKF